MDGSATQNRLLWIPLSYSGSVLAEILMIRYWFIYLCVLFLLGEKVANEQTFCLIARRLLLPMDTGNITEASQLRCRHLEDGEGEGMGLRYLNSLGET